MPRENSKSVNAELRRYQTIQLKVAGASERAIAEQLGVSRGLVHREIIRALGDLAQQSVGSADELRALQMERYTQLLLSWWQSGKATSEGLKNVLQIMGRIDSINGLIPNRPLINMVDASQTAVFAGNMGMEDILHDDDVRTALDLIAERMESVTSGDGSQVVGGSLDPPSPSLNHIA